MALAASMALPPPMPMTRSAPKPRACSTPSRADATLGSPRTAKVLTGSRRSASRVNRGSLRAGVPPPTTSTGYPARSHNLLPGPGCPHRTGCGQRSRTRMSWRYPHVRTKSPPCSSGKMFAYFKGAARSSWGRQYRARSRSGPSPCGCRIVGSAIDLDWAFGCPGPQTHHGLATILVGPSRFFRWLTLACHRALLTPFMKGDGSIPLSYGHVEGGGW